MEEPAEFLEDFLQRAGILFSDTPCLFGTRIVVIATRITASSTWDLFWWGRIAGHGASVVSEPKSGA